MAFIPTIINSIRPTRIKIIVNIHRSISHGREKILVIITARQKEELLIVIFIIPIPKTLIFDERIIEQAILIFQRLTIVHWPIGCHPINIFASKNLTPRGEKNPVAPISPGLDHWLHSPSADFPNNLPVGHCSHCTGSTPA
jgi:hypothetical protein